MMIIMIMIIIIIIIWELKTPCIIPTVPSTKTIITNNLHDRLKVLNLLPFLYILIKKILTRYKPYGQNVLAEHWI